MAKNNELKTKKNEANVLDFIKNSDSPASKDDCMELIQLMERTTNSKPKMWGPSIVGFGSYTYKYASGREGDWFVCGFSPRKQGFSVYLMCDLQKPSTLLNSLGKFKMGKSCLNIKTLADIDLNVLEKLIIHTQQKTQEQ